MRLLYKILQSKAVSSPGKYCWGPGLQDITSTNLLITKTVYIIRMHDKKSNIKAIKVGDEKMKDITDPDKN